MRKVRLLLFGLLSLFIISVGKSSSKSDISSSITPEDINEIKPEITIVEDPSIRKEIERRPNLYFPSDDAMTYLSNEYTEKTPLVEISFYVRKMDGSVKPLKVDNLKMMKDDWSFHYGVDRTKMRLQLGPERIHIETLGFGQEYTVVGVFPSNKNDQYEYLGNTPEYKLLIPEKVEEGKICKIKLVLIDEILEHKLKTIENAREEAEQKLKEEIAKRETIKVTFTEKPPSPFAVLYNDGSRSREAGLADPNDNFIEIKGPNKSGGELMVYAPELGMRQWAFIKNLQKREITLPKDADLFYKKDNLVDFEITFQDTDITKLKSNKVEGISFYISEKSNMPLFWVSINDKRIKSQSKGTKILSLKIEPGKYYARIGEPMQDQISLGTVTINKTGSNTWKPIFPITVIISDKKDVSEFIK